MKKTLFVLAALVFTHAAHAAAHVWQESASSSVTLGVRDKFANERDVSTVTFTVVGKDVHKTYSLERRTNGDDFLYVKFPEDFTDGSLIGRYSWTATVEGKKVAGGTFTNEY